MTLPHDDVVGPEGPTRRPWLLPLLAAVVILALGVTTAVLLRQQGGPTSSTSPSVTVTSTRSTGSTTTAAPSVGSSSAAPSRPTASGASPVYYVAKGTAQQPWLLTRDFVPTAAASGQTALMDAALAVLVSGKGADGQALPYPGLRTPWAPGTTARSGIAANGDLTVTLSKPGDAGGDAELARIAVQSLVWTATAAAQTTKPVVVSVEGGGAVFPDRPAKAYTRPDESWRDLAPIWVSAPSRWQPVAGGAPITVEGQATVFEGTLQWRLTRADGSEVAKGSTRASQGAPARGDWALALPALSSGRYTFTAFATSQKDGAVAYEVAWPLTVG